MFEMPMASIGVHVFPPILFNQLDNVSDFHRDPCERTADHGDKF
jgi:hypothetical protein